MRRSGKTRQLVNQVFTPRRSEVNSDIYVARPALEKQLFRTLSGSMHTVLYGESGSGKSWLYKKVLADKGAYVAVANCANALRFGSLTQEIGSVAGIENPRRLTGMSETVKAELNAAVAKGGASSTREYEFAAADPLIDCFRAIREKAGKRFAVLVVDNLETIFGNPELMSELGAIITLLDDARYAKYEVKFLIVGVPGDVTEYFTRTPNQATVANRLAEVSEVKALSAGQVNQLVRKGFIDLLKVTLSDEDLGAWEAHINQVTLGLAQPVHEYCEQLAYIVEDSHWLGVAEQLTQADSEWLARGLSQASAVVAKNMNVRETGKGRRNQVLYAIGLAPDRSFHVSAIDEIVRRAFPESTKGTTLAIGQVLSQLSTGQEAILRRPTKAPVYEIRDARVAMALRVMLEKPRDEERIVRSER
jgi:hypothetical protein